MWLRKLSKQFYFRIDVFPNSLTILLKFGLLLKEYLLPKPSKYNPIWSHWLAVIILKRKTSLTYTHLPPFAVREDKSFLHFIGKAMLPIMKHKVSYKNVSAWCVKNQLTERYQKFPREYGHRIFCNGPSPASFRLFSSLSTTILAEKLWTSVGFEHGSLDIRRACGPLDHHHGPIIY